MGNYTAMRDNVRQYWQWLVGQGLQAPPEVSQDDQYRNMVEEILADVNAGNAD